MKSLQLLEDECRGGAQGFVGFPTSSPYPFYPQLGQYACVTLPVSALALV